MDKKNKIFWAKIGAMFFILMVTASLGLRMTNGFDENRQPSSVDGYGNDVKPLPPVVTEKTIEREMEEIKESEYDLNKVDIALAEMQKSATPQEPPPPPPPPAPRKVVKPTVVKKTAKPLKKAAVNSKSAKSTKKPTKPVAAATKKKSLKDGRDPASQKLKLPKKKKTTAPMIPVEP